MYELGVKPSAIRNLFEYGKQRKALIGEENVFDFSLGNPNVPSPEIVNQTLLKLINEKDPALLHGYTSAVGDNDVRKEVASYLNKTYDVNVDADLIYMTVGAAAALTISLNAILNENDEVIVIAPFFPEYKVFIEKAKGKVVIANSYTITSTYDTTTSIRCIDCSSNIRICNNNFLFWIINIISST